MKPSLWVILILGVAFTLVTFVVARNQVYSQEQDLRSDLKKRVETLAESLQENVEPFVQRRAASQLSPVVDRSVGLRSFILKHDGVAFESTIANDFSS
jgi:hypothetical protein